MRSWRLRKNVMPSDLKFAAFIIVCTLVPMMALGQSSAFASSCTELKESVVDALKEKNTEVMRRQVDLLSISPGCDQSARDWSRQALARLITQNVRTAVIEGQNIKDQADSLRLALTYAQVWQAAAWLGDIAYDQHAYADAAVHYQEALTAISDEKATPESPPLPIIEHLFDRAEITRLAADRYIPSPTTRSGNPAGTASPNIRGFVPKKVMIPIEFKFDSVQFTDRGASAAADLARQLALLGPVSIKIVGHTDPKGSRDHNQSLSLGRAAAVRDYLIKSNFRGTIAIEGHGEDDPIKVDEQSRFTQEQYYQILRRVEVVK